MQSVAIICLTTSFAAPAAAAADADIAALDEVIVTAQRKAERLQDVPVSVSAVSDAELQRDDVKDIGDYFALIPNVSWVTAGSRDRKDISIRGVSNQLDPYNDARQATYAYYVDDFNVVALTSNPQIADLERIEVLRGPQGTFFGRNAEGGAINISTNKPTGDWHEEVGADYSSFNTWKLDGVIDAPIDQNVALRVSGHGETTDGNIRNINPIGGGNNATYYSFRGVLRVKPTDNITWDTTVSYSNENTGMRDGVPTGYLTATWRAVYYHNRPGFIANPDDVGFYPENRDLVNFNTPQSVGDVYYYGSSRAVIGFEDFDLTGIVGYGVSLVHNIGDVDGSSHDYFNEIDHIDRHTLNGEIRAQSTGQSRLEWSVGTNVGKDGGTTAQNTMYGSQAVLLGFNHPAGFQITGNYSQEEDTYAGVFAQATYHLFNNFDLTAGGRYSYESITGNFLTLSNESTTGNYRGLSSDYSDFSPKFTVSYKPFQDFMSYATVSKGFKSGGVQAASVGIAQTYLPETLWNYEAGIKWDLLNHRLHFDTAGFYEDWSNVQQQIRYQYLSPTTGQLLAVTGVANAASAHSEGAESSVNFKATDEIRLEAHIGYTEAVYDHYPTALVDGAIVNANGKPLVDAPKWTMGSTASYERPAFNDYDGFAQLEWNYRSSMLSSTYALRYNYFPFISPSYNNFNLRLGVESNRFRIVAYAENLFDANYFQNAFEKAFYSGVQVDPSYRRFGISTYYKF
jgi:iron complex outermembrane receptor protein